MIIWANDHKFFVWVKKYWFYRPSKMSLICRLTYLFSMALFILSLLDLRGEEVSTSANVMEQNTIILIDNSESMLVEDVTPNRFKRAIMLARHFVKNSVGHKIAIVLFSDIQRRIVPFTDDLDLLDSRLAALDELSVVGGGSNLKSALNESVQYFREMSDDLTEITGNILAISDFEFHDAREQLRLPSSIVVAAIGVGTVRGGNIPQRLSSGVLNDFKRYQGSLVVSALSERSIIDLGNNFKEFKYWIPLSDGVYSNEILKFFRDIYKEKLKKGTISSRPVLVNYLLIPAIALFILSVFFSLFKTFKVVSVVAIVVMAFSFNSKIYASTTQADRQLNKMLDKLKKGELSQKERLSLAEKLLRNDETDKALTLYGENIKNINDADKEVRFNVATAHLKKKNLRDGIMRYKLLASQLNESMVADDKILSEMRKNVLLALSLNGNGKGKGGEKEKNEDESSSSSKSQGEKQKKGSGQGESAGEDDKNEKNKKEEKEKKEEGKKGDKESEQPPPPPSLEEFEKNIEQKRKMAKVPALLKQLLSDDREVQKKYYQTKKQQLGSNNRKDW